MPIRTSDQSNELTPMMTQYFQLREKCGEAILFFRMGDFYEIFGDDALEVAPKLEVQLTSREKGGKKRIPFCGVPHHSARNYWLKLIRMGYKVALADQVEDASEAKGLVKRDIIRTYTPGCIDELEALDQHSPNYAMALLEDPKEKKWAIAIFDVSTGEFRLGLIDSEADVPSMVERFRPKEILVRKFYLDDARQLLKTQISQMQVSFGILPEAGLRDEESQKELLSVNFGAEEVSSQACGKVVGGNALVTSVLIYLAGLKSSYSQFRFILPLFDPETMPLDETAIRDLELFETSRSRQKEGALFNDVNRCLSPMGARLLRQSLMRPFVSRKPIERRRTAVKELFDQESQVLESLRCALTNIPDLERLSTRIQSGRAQPQEVGRIRVTLEKVSSICDILEEEAFSGAVLAGITHDLSGYRDSLSLLNDTLSDDIHPLGSLSIFQKGFDAEFDEARDLSENGELKISEYEERLRSETKISSLKIKKHKTYGLLIEVTKTNLHKVPAHFIKRQTMVNNERFVTTELKDLDEALSSAMELAVSREGYLYNQLLIRLGAFHDSWSLIAKAVANLDLLQGFAFKALESQWCAPKFSRDGSINLKGSRHPVVESFVGRHEFVPNDIMIEKGRNNLLITGPNMAGKSTVMRQMALSAILNQVGSWLPAVSAKLPIFDRIFTRVGASDDLSRGQSTFMVEMSEAAQILRQATDKSLVILDEVGRGTSTQDGLALATAILEELCQKVGCYAFFATHYHELVPIAEKFESVKLAQTEVHGIGDTIEFTHRLIDGSCDSSFGLEVAKIAGMPTRVVDSARRYLAESTPESSGRSVKNKKNLAKIDDVSQKSGKIVPPMEILGLQLVETEFCGDQLLEISRRLDSVKIHTTTPLQALNILNDLKVMSQKAQQIDLFGDSPN